MSEESNKVDKVGTSNDNSNNSTNNNNIPTPAAETTNSTTPATTNTTTDTSNSNHHPTNTSISNNNNNADEDYMDDGDDPDDSREDRKPWTREEDEKVAQLVAIHGTKKWSIVGAALSGRTGKQCRERWYLYLENSNQYAWLIPVQTIL